MDRIDDCTLIVSRRGIYDRAGARRRRQPTASPASNTSTRQGQSHNETRTHLRHREDQWTANNNPNGNFQSEHSVLLSNPGAPGLTSPASNSVDNSQTPETPRELRDFNHGQGQHTHRKESSLVEMFEAFLKSQSEGSPRRPGIVLLGEPSPLTFALGELQHTQDRGLHDVSGQINESTSTAVSEQDVHPSHLAECDIVYLKAKGAFDYPDNATFEPLFRSYIERFHPLYSIVRKDQFEKACHERRLPWIILHAVCFIGATFCDRVVIHQSGFKSRLEARLSYYEKAKVLFTLGYETDRIVLLKSILMLSFCGPHLQSYWNPGSWVGFGVTIAVSLGLHRVAGSVRTHSKEDTSLLRRLWWTLVGRDAYASALLGRSLRLNLSLCDTPPLTVKDFEDETACYHQEDHDCSCKQSIHYQVHVSELSMILRSILHHRFGPGQSTTSGEDLNQKLLDWQWRLPRSLNWSQQTAPLPMFSLILKILFNYHLILLNMEKPGRVSSPSNPAPPFSGGQSMAVAESAASVIASTAVAIMTKISICALPHDIFPGFFLAAIIFYRATRHADPETREKGRASLDNCQIVLNEAGESWDSGNWAVKLFEFLLSSGNETDDPLNPVNRPETNGHNAQHGGLASVTADNIDPLSDISRQRFLRSVDAGTGLAASFSAEFGDLMLMPNYWLPAVEDVQGFPW